MYLHIFQKANTNTNMKAVTFKKILALFHKCIKITLIVYLII